jgi:hypothetical protein
MASKMLKELGEVFVDKPVVAPCGMEIERIEEFPTTNPYVDGREQMWRTRMKTTWWRWM